MSARPADTWPGRTAPFFDQGIFLLHLNRGKEHLRLGHYQESKRDLEDALRLRPQEPEVLANLAFALFHLGQFEEAEKISRVVLASFPASVPLLFNLGLILYKAGRHAEAREPLEKVLELAPAHRKAHLTLGLVFRKLDRTEQAEEQFRLAGAERAAGGDEDDTLSRLARAAVAEKAKESMSDREVVTTPIVKLERFQEEEGAAPSEERAALPVGRPAVDEAARSAPLPIPPPVAAPNGPFAPVAGGFLTAETAGGILIRRDAVTGRRGASTREPESSLPEPLSRLFLRARGPGTLLLVEKGRHPFFVAPGGGFLSVAPLHVLAFEGSLGYREDPAFEFRRPDAPPFLKLLGEGFVALAVSGEPARIPVVASEPLTIAADAVIGYSGELSLQLIEANSRYAEFAGRAIFRFSGTGTVLAEAG